MNGLSPAEFLLGVAAIATLFLVPLVLVGHFLHRRLLRERRRALAEANRPLAGQLDAEAAQSPAPEPAASFAEADAPFVHAARHKAVYDAQFRGVDMFSRR